MSHQFTPRDAAWIAAYRIDGPDRTCSGGMRLVSAIAIVTAWAVPCAVAYATCEHVLSTGPVGRVTVLLALIASALGWLLGKPLTFGVRAGLVRFGAKEAVWTFILASYAVLAIVLTLAVFKAVVAAPETDPGFAMMTMLFVVIICFLDAFAFADRLRSCPEHSAWLEYRGGEVILPMEREIDCHRSLRDGGLAALEGIPLSDGNPEGDAIVVYPLVCPGHPECRMVSLQTRKRKGETGDKPNFEYTTVFEVGPIPEQARLRWFPEFEHWLKPSDSPETSG